VTLPHGNYEIDDLGEYAGRDWTPRQKTYAAMVTRLDTDVGRLLALLKELKIDDKTVVLMAGDNGSSFAPDSEIGRLFDQAQGLRGFKRSMYEGGLRQAALVRWPGVVPAGRVCDEPWAFWDFLPTVADWTGAKIPAGVKTDGLSLAAFFRGGAAPARECFYWELHEGEPIQAVRFGNWKAVRNGPQAPFELYDLAKDPGERTDLAAQHPAEVVRAQALITASRVDDPNFPWKAPAPNPAKPKDKQP
jgi:arylsulfatase A-like enzyme